VDRLRACSKNRITVTWSVFTNRIKCKPRIFLPHKCIFKLADLRINWNLRSTSHFQNGWWPLFYSVRQGCPTRGQQSDMKTSDTSFSSNRTTAALSRQFAEQTPTKTFFVVKDSSHLDGINIHNKSGFSLCQLNHRRRSIPFVCPVFENRDTMVAHSRNVKFLLRMKNHENFFQFFFY